jgi:hypothetical protein
VKLSPVGPTGHIVSFSWLGDHPAQWAARSTEHSLAADIFPGWMTRRTLRRTVWCSFLSTESRYYLVLIIISQGRASPLVGGSCLGRHVDVSIRISHADSMRKKRQTAKRKHGARNKVPSTTSASLFNLLLSLHYCLYGFYFLGWWKKKSSSKPRLYACSVIIKTSQILYV